MAYINDFFIRIAEYRKEQKRLKYSIFLVDMKDRTCNMLHNTDITSIQIYANDISVWIKSNDVLTKKKNQFVKPESERKNLYIPFLNVDGYLGRDTFQAITNIFLSLNETYVNDYLHRKNISIIQDNPIHTACIISDINGATFRDIHRIANIFNMIRNEMYHEFDIRHSKKEKLEEEQIKSSMQSKSNIQKLEDFCKPNGTKFEVIKKGSSTIMTLNGEELPKTTDRSKDFHNGYIEGFRRAIVIVQRIMGFKLFNESNKNKDNKRRK